MCGLKFFFYLSRYVAFRNLSQHRVLQISKHFTTVVTDFTITIAALYFTFLWEQSTFTTVEN